MKLSAKHFVIASVIGVAAISYRFREDYFEISKNLEIFNALYRELNVYYVDAPNPGELIKTGIDAMLASLDPYTQYIPESDIEDYRFMTTGQYGGVGALIRQINDTVYVSEPYEGFPAQKVGLKAGDRIVAIDGKSVVGKAQDEISEMLKGASGTKLSVTIQRQGSEQTLELTREEIKIADVPYNGLLDDGKTGYIALNSFTPTASAEVAKAFKALKSEGMERLVLDLRGNGGGLLGEAVNIVNFFVPKGSEVVKTKSRLADWDQTYLARNEPLDTEIPLVVLVDGGSASASEIVAGSLQDLDRAVVVGQTTFGKGLVQQTKKLHYNSQLKLTIAKYYIPSGRCIQKLDYTHRDEEGNVVEVPDSLLKTFYTKGGRPVVDGRGIEPDIHVDMQEIPPILISLVRENYFFLFANDYMYSHPEIAGPREFALSESEYQAFQNYLSNKDYHYTTGTETVFNRLRDVAEQEQYLEIANEAFREMEASLKQIKNNDLELFKDEIKSVLEDEIVSRYYFQKGRIQASFDRDPYLSRVDSLFANNLYAGVLSGEVKEDLPAGEGQN